MKNHEEMLRALLNKATLVNTKSGQTCYMREDGILVSDAYFSPNPFQLIFQRTYLENWEIAPKYIQVNGIDVPSPLTIEPERHDTYWTIDFREDDLVEEFTWASDEFDMRLFERGLCHSTEENALKHAEALLKFGI